MEEQLEEMQKPINQWAFPRVLVGIPMERALSNADIVVPRIAALGQLGVNFIWLPYTSRIDIARNMMGMALLEKDFTHLIMLDSDHEFPVGDRDIVRALARWAVRRPDAKVVGAMNFMRRLPFSPCCYIETEDPDVWAIPTKWEKGLMKVISMGTGAIMIAREVFEELTMPWFYNDYRFAWEMHFPGEDTGFCAKCRDANIPIYVDTSITCPHITTATVDESTFRSNFSVNGMNDEQEFMKAIKHASA